MRTSRLTIMTSERLCCGKNGAERLGSAAVALSAGSSCQGQQCKPCKVQASGYPSNTSSSCQKHLPTKACERILALQPLLLDRMVAGQLSAEVTGVRATPSKQAWWTKAQPT